MAICQYRSLPFGLEPHLVQDFQRNIMFLPGGGPRVVVSTAAFHARVRGSVPGLGGLKETKMFLPHPRVKVSIVGSLRDREVACSASDRQGSNFESCVWRTVSSQSSHHPQEVLLAQFSLYVHKGGLKPDSFHFYHVSPLSILGYCFDVVSSRARHFTLKCFTSLRWNWVPGRREMPMCMISSMRPNGCRTAVV